MFEENKKNKITKNLFKEWTDNDFLNEEKVIEEIGHYRKFDSYCSLTFEYGKNWYLEQFKNDGKNKSLGCVEKSQIKKINKMVKQGNWGNIWDKYTKDKAVAGAFAAVESKILFHNDYFNEVYDALYNEKNQNFNNLNPNKIFQALNAVEYQTIEVLFSFYEGLSKLYGVTDLKEIFKNGVGDIDFLESKLTQNDFQGFEFKERTFNDCLIGNYGQFHLETTYRSREQIVYGLKNLFDFYSEGQKLKYGIDLKEGSEFWSNEEIKPLDTK